MLYSNYEAVESHLSKLGSNCDPVSLYGFLPRKELDQLCKSFSEEITINYDKSQMKLQGADYRTAHLMCNLTANKLYFYALMPPKLAHSSKGLVEEIPQEEKQRVEEIRSFFIGNSDNVKLFNQEVNKLLWPNKVVDSDIKVPILKKDTPGKSETAPNNVNSQQTKPYNSQQSSNSDENNVTSKSSQKSKLPAIAASALGIAGVISGITIAVY
ncbi:hypothetical protein [Wolbachia endosymbiont of Psylliodes chrysocephala]|uniref:hypothetical protein n=2 Tax=unclassified Wolbachia TaxID=2640676 RepID=UPI0020A18ADF|nr:hypothetical protein [Wolbachia endosymbiont of Psylliodes chrysocephala]